MYDWNTHITSTLPHVIYEHNCLPTRVWMKRLLFLHEAHWQRLICSVWSRTNTKDSFITLSSFLLIFLFWALLCSHFCPGSSCFSSRPAEFQSLFFLIKAGVGMCFGGQSRTHMRLRIRLQNLQSSILFWGLILCYNPVRLQTQAPRCFNCFQAGAPLQAGGLKGGSKVPITRDDNSIHWSRSKG